MLAASVKITLLVDCLVGDVRGQLVKRSNGGEAECIVFVSMLFDNRLLVKILLPFY